MRKVGSGIYKHKPAPQSHPWRKAILSDVIRAKKMTSKQWVSELKELFKKDAIYHKSL